MRRTSRLLLRMGLLFTLAEGLAWAVVPLTVLGQKADVIVLARVGEMRGDGTGAMRAILQPLTILKGQVPAPVDVVLPPSPLMKQFASRDIFATSNPTGLWFLKHGEGGVYEVLPVATVTYTENDAFLPMPEGWTPPPGSLDQKLLSAVVSFYESRREPNFDDRGMLLVTLENADRQAAMSIAEEFMAPQNSVDRRVLGFNAAIQMGSDAALARVSQEIGSLRSGKYFLRIIADLQTYYQPHGNASIPVLRDLIERHSDIAGLAVAAGKALQKIRTKEVLPVMVLLLDSPDRDAQATAAWYFHFYTALAGPDGNFNTSGDGNHPFWNDQTREHASTRGGTIPPDQLVTFWKSWWSQNRARIGFPQQ